ncbi:glycosyltransferase [Saccharothrix sp. ALI-22-I]|uniref:glycosyltransferase n=1 Tax=Saccharothrix sp. ALI-22-I TaxID=1933778 RepID=UPI0015C30F01|nr:galactosyltransferase-related protein [Saccharothrix sp. ALI-22-I]
MLASAVTDSIVVWTDSGSRDAAVIFWHWSREWLSPVVQAIHDIPDEQVQKNLASLLSNPGCPSGYHGLRNALVELADRSPGATRELFRLAWRAESNSRIGYHLGERYQSDQADLLLADLSARPRPLGSAADDAPVLIVVPFRDATGTEHRVRNAVACLRALTDQSFPREHYAITVVESDREARWQGVLEPLCDNYIFARDAGPFNKSWATNVGVRNTRGQHEVICVMDADVLADRHFLSRNVARFMERGVQSFLPYREMFCLDPPSTSAAIGERLFGAAESPSESRLRGFLIRRPPGLCFWIRKTAFDRVAGMDERYAGWGGEDTDFALRVSVKAPLDRWNDRLIHLHHPPSSAYVNGRTVNHHIPPMSWPAHSDIGRVDRFEAGGVR